jgi:alpha-L-rhamnosidase
MNGCRFSEAEIKSISDDSRSLFKLKPHLQNKLVINYQDGSADSILSDGSWRSGAGHIRKSDIYNGELDDNRISGGTWVKVKTGITSQVNEGPYNSDPVRQQERFFLRQIFTSPAGETIVDFGQNMAGWVRLQVKGHKGDTVRISHGEILDKNGNFYMGNMGKDSPVDVYTERRRNRDTGTAFYLSRVPLCKNRRV